MMFRLSYVAALVVLTACSSSSEPSDPNPPLPQEGFVQLAIAGGRTCGVSVDSLLYCWGPRHGDDNGYATVPDREEQDEPIVEVTGQGWLICAVGASSAITCDGEFFHDKSLLPADDDRLTSSTGLRSVAVSMGHGCGINARRMVECFGSMYDGKVGRTWDPAGFDSLGYDWQASAIPSDLQVLALTGGYRHSCAITRAEEVYCWGDSTVIGNPGAPFLDGNPCRGGPCILNPVRVLGLGHVRSIAAGQSHTCAATDAGTFCWGLNFAGQLGTPGAQASPVPVAVDLPSKARILASGQSKTCAIADNGKVYCWGQWGGNQATAPTVVPGDYPRFTSLAVGSGQACGLFAGEAWCWGLDGSWLGNGNGNGSAVPIRIDIQDQPPS